MDRYFIDESGHGGDLASSTSLDFSGQPIFALACVGVRDVGSLGDELDRLRSSHRCGPGELKSSAVGAKLPAIAFDLTRWLVENDAALFVELVEKRYFLAIHIVNHLLCGPYGLDEVDPPSRSEVAEFISGSDFDALLLAYLDACRSQSLDVLKGTLELCWEMLDRSDARVARNAQILTMYARDRAHAREAKAEDFLPLADQGKTGKKVWMLPNLQCLTNIYARINQSRRQGLGGVTLVHDAQLQYDDVLADAKAVMERLAKLDSVPVTPFSDYRLRGHANLVFATGADEPSLQAADILAGSAMRFARRGLERNGRKDPALREAFFHLLKAGNPILATGINLVVSDRLLALLDVPTIPAAPFVR